MASFTGELPIDLIQMFETLEVNTTGLLGAMVEAGAEVAKENVEANMPRTLKSGLMTAGDSVKLTKVYKTPSDDGINCQVIITGYFINRNGEKTPAPLVANLFEYGRSTSPYPKKPFLRRSFNKADIEKAMIEAQERYMKEKLNKQADNWRKLFR